MELRLGISEGGSAKDFSSISQAWLGTFFGEGIRL